MSRDYGYGGRGGGRGGDRWDTERFEVERERARFTDSRDRFEERDSGFGRDTGFGRPRERSAEEIHERRGPRGFEEDRYERREYYNEEPRYERERERERPMGRDRGQSITIEKEREFYSPSPPRRAPARPGFLRRQSSLDTFDRKPMGQLTRFEREEYGPPAARYREEARLPPLVPIPLPRTRQLGPPPRRYAERDYEEIRVAEPEFYGDDEYRGFPERVREREIIRRRRRSRSRSRSRGAESRASHSVRSSSSSSGVSERSGTTSRTAKSHKSVRSEFPKKGKTRMPARLVSKKALIDLDYPFEEEGDVIIIQKALGRENIDEVIKLSEDYKNSEIVPEVETTLTTYLVGPEAEMSGARSEAGHTVFEERRTQEVFTIPPPPPPVMHAPPPAHTLEVVTDTKIVERSPSPARTHVSHHSHHGHGPPIIIEARGPPQSDFYETKQTTIVESSDPMPVGPLALALPASHGARSTSSIRQEIKALEAEKEALRLEKRADREMRKADRIRRGGGRVSEGDLVLYEQRDTYDYPREETTVVRREYVEPDGGVKITKDKKVSGVQKRAIKAMLKTLT